MAEGPAESASDVAAALLDDAQKLVNLQVELGRAEARELARRYIAAMGMLTTGATLLIVVLFVVLPLLVLRQYGFQTKAILIWLVIDVVIAVALLVAGRFAFKPPDPATMKTVVSLKETRAWLARQIRSSAR